VSFTGLKANLVVVDDRAPTAKRSLGFACVDAEKTVAAPRMQAFTALFVDEAIEPIVMDVIIS
jgi:hypothetical protein